MMTADDGLVSAIAYGAHSQKGKLRGLVVPFHRGVCYLYTNPVKDRSKITDFDVREYYPGIRESIDRFYAASLWAEVLLKSYAGGRESGPVYELLVGALDVLGAAEDRSRVRRATAQFLWRYFRLLGSAPETDRCGSCGRELEPSEPRWYRPYATGVICTDCAGGEAAQLAPGALRYLAATAERPFAEAVGVGLEGAALAQLAGFLHALAEGILEADLNTLRTGRGIL